MRNILFVISGPSGVGKGTIANMIAERNPNVFVSVSMTTRPARQGETDGKDYYFVTRETFEQKIKNGGLLEYSEHFENFYGTPRDKVLEKLHERDVLLEIDVNGGLEVKKQFPETVLIMIVPPRIEDLRARLSGRKTETEEKNSSCARRLRTFDHRPVRLHCLERRPRALLCRSRLDHRKRKKPKRR